MKDINMTDIFKLPMICEQGDGYLYSNDARYSISFDDSDVNMMQQKEAVCIAINNHDQLTKDNLDLIDRVEWLHSKLMQEGERYGASLSRTETQKLIDRVKGEQC